MREFGGEEGIAGVYRHNHELARWAGAFLADRWGTPFTTPAEMLSSMVTVRLPDRLGHTVDDARRVQAALDAATIEVPVYGGPEGLSMRVCAQVYCERADIEQLAEAVADLAG